MNAAAAKAKAGQKICPECQTVNGVRAKECKKCSHKFPVGGGKSKGKKSGTSELDQFIFEQEKINLDTLRSKYKPHFENLAATNEFIAKHGSAEKAIAAIKAAKV